MRQRKIGSLSVSVIGLGTNNFGFTMAEDAVLPVVDAALEAGINFFDTADSYLTSPTCGYSVVDGPMYEPA
jgi:aryl-alcohol dehydrogenase-like predicted oxidoreductase